MVARLLSIIGVIIILLSLCTLLLLPSPTRSLVRGVAQAENLVDSSIGPLLAQQAGEVVDTLLQSITAASGEGDLRAIIAAATAQADLINSAATDSDREALITALRDVSEGIAVAQDATVEAQAIPSSTPTPTDTPPSTPSPTSIPTQTASPVPPTETPEPTPPTLPETGDALLQVVPTLMVEANWPKQTEVNHSDFIRVTLVQISEGVFVSTVEAGVERDVIAATPKPVPNSTPEVPIQNAFGDGYRSFAVAKLSIGETAFEVTGPNPRERQSLDRPEISWTWNITPKQRGQHVANLLVEVEWEDIIVSGQDPEPFTIWSPDLTINVAEPPFLARGQLDLLGILGALIGSGLNIPFLYKVVQDLRKKREGKEQDSE